MQSLTLNALGKFVALVSLLSANQPCLPAVKHGKQYFSSCGGVERKPVTIRGL
jgi:hypothetical protein